MTDGTMRLLSIVGFISGGQLQLVPSFAVDADDRQAQQDPELARAEDVIAVEVLDSVGDVLVRTHLLAQPLCILPPINKAVDQKEDSNSRVRFLNALVQLPANCSTIRLRSNEN